MLEVEGRPVTPGAHLQWLWCSSRNGHVHKVDCCVTGFTPKRIRVRVFDAEGQPVTKTINPDDMLWPRPSLHSNMVGQGNANDLEKWLAFNRTLTWDRLAP